MRNTARLFVVHDPHPRHGRLNSILHSFELWRTTCNVKQLAVLTVWLRCPSCRRPTISLQFIILLLDQASDRSPDARGD